MLGLDVREQPLEDARRPTDGASTRSCSPTCSSTSTTRSARSTPAPRLLAPGGVLCVVTPDPSSPPRGSPARAGGATCPRTRTCCPRRTLRELLTARGLVISDDAAARAHVRARLLAGRARRARRPRRQRAAARRPDAARAAAASRSSLGDERVVLAHRVAGASSRPSRSSADRGGDAAACTSCCRPTRAAETIPAVATEMPVDAADRALLVDDASPDETPEVALREGFERAAPARQPRLRRATRRPCYVRALLDGADVVVMVHADNQYDPALVARMVRRSRPGIADVVIGSRLLEDETIAGGMPRWKWIGNRVADRGREPRLPARLLGVPHRLPRVSRPTSCAASRSCATPTTSSSTRRSSPRSSRAAPRRRAADPDALLPRGVERVVPRLASATASRRSACSPASGCDERGRRWPAARAARRAAPAHERERRRGARVTSPETAARSLGGASPATPPAQAAGKAGRSWRSAPPRSPSRRATSARRATATDARAGARSRRSACSPTPGSSRSSCARSAATPARTAELVGNALAMRLAPRRRGRRAGARRRAALPSYGPAGPQRRADRVGRRSCSGSCRRARGGLPGRGCSIGRAAFADVAGARRRASRRCSRSSPPTSASTAVVASAVAGAATARRADDRALAPRDPRAPARRPHGLARAARRGAAARAHARGHGDLLPRRHVHPALVASRVDDVGDYALAYRLYELLALFPALVMTSVFPILSRQVPAGGGAAQRTLDATARAFLVARAAARRGRAGRGAASSRGWPAGSEFDGGGDTAAAAALRGRARLPVGPARLRADRRRAPAHDAAADRSPRSPSTSRSTSRSCRRYGADRRGGGRARQRGAAARRRLVARAAATSALRPALAGLWRRRSRRR